MSSRLEPMVVRAHLQSGIAQASAWSIALDGLLAARVWRGVKAQRRAAGQEPVALYETPSPEDLELPLAQCRLGCTEDLEDGADRWHWAATTAWPEQMVEGTPPDVRTWTGRIDHRVASQLASSVPKVVSDRQGRYRARRMPLLATVCRAVSWRAVGDLDAVRALVEPVRAIGKKRSHGEGHVLGWEVLAAPELEEWEAGHLHPDQTLGRPSPEACLIGREISEDGGYGLTGLRPPAMHPSRQRRLRLPVPLHR